MTLFAKLPKITLWPVYTQAYTQYEPSMRADGTMVPDPKLGRIAGQVFEDADQFIGKLGNPVGVKSYKPFHFSGEDHLPSYLGMVGIPMEIVAEFPTDAQTVLLTEQARFDPAIVLKIKKQLVDGRPVVITTGLLKALQGKGIEDISDMVYKGRTVSTHEFMSERKFVGVKSDSEIPLPQITYFTNDAGSIINAYTSESRTSGNPIMLETKYSKGLMYVLTIPNARGDLYSYPPQVLSGIREVLAKGMFVRLDTARQVSLYVYDNDTFVIESFRQDPMRAVVITDKRITKLRDLRSGLLLTGTEKIGGTSFEMPLNPGSYRVFSAE